MAGLLDPLESLTDILSPIIPPTDDGSTDSVSVSVITVPVTVSVTVSGSGTTSVPTSTSTHTSSNSTTTLPTTTSSNSNGTEPDFITTTYLTSQGTELMTITAIISNPAGHIHNNQATSNNAFFNNRTAVIGVFTTVGVIVFIIFVALIGWGARRRTLKRRRQEEDEKNSRDFFEDEVNDVGFGGEPSEKSWWGNTSGASIPEGGGVPMQVVSPGGYNNAPPMPPLPSEYSHSSNQRVSESAMVMPHPYASTSPSFISDQYSSSMTLERNNSLNTSVTSPTRDKSRSPPPGTSLPTVPYRNPSSPQGHLPQITEGHVASPLLSPTVRNHPFASPPTNRRSELFVEDVLWGLGDEGGVGRSLSGRRAAEPLPPLPTIPSDRPLPPPDRPQMHPSNILNQPQYLSYPAPTMPASPNETTEYTHTVLNHSATNIRQRPTSGISEGGWYDDSNSETGKAPLTGATASGESFLNGSRQGHNERFGYPYTSTEPRASESHISLKDKSATTSDVVVPERKMPHDPRFSGLFGNVVSHQGNVRDEGRRSEDYGSEYESHAHGMTGNRVLRVTNE